MAVIGGSGKRYSKSSNGTIKVSYKDGSSRTISPGQKGYANTNTAMKNDTGSNKPTSSGSRNSSGSSSISKPTNSSNGSSSSGSSYNKSQSQSSLNNKFAGMDSFINAGTNAGNRLVNPSSGESLGFSGGYKYAADGGYEKLYNDLVSGNVMTNDQYAGQQAAYEQQQAILRAQEESRKAIEAQINSSVAGMQANEGKINQGYEDLARQAFVQAKVGQNNLTENLALNGINGGATESAILGIENQYQQSLAGIGQDKQNALNQLQSDIAKVKSSGNAQLAQTMSDYYMKLAEASIAADNENYNRLMNGLNMAMQQSQITGQFNGKPTLQAQQLAYEQAMRNKMFESDNEYRNSTLEMSKIDSKFNRQQEIRANALNEIEMFGKVVSNSLIQALGGQSVADQMAGAYKNQISYMNSFKKKSRSSGGSSYDYGSIPQSSNIYGEKEESKSSKTLEGGTSSNVFQSAINKNTGIDKKTPAHIINEYYDGKISYEQLSKMLAIAGMNPQQFGVKKG